MCACVCTSVYVCDERDWSLRSAGPASAAWRPRLHGHVWGSRSIVGNLEQHKVDTEMWGASSKWSDVCKYKGDLLWSLLLWFMWVFQFQNYTGVFKTRVGQRAPGPCLVHGTLLHSFWQWFEGLTAVWNCRFESSFPRIPLWCTSMVHLPKLRLLMPFSEDIIKKDRKSSCCIPAVFDEKGRKQPAGGIPLVND